MRQVRSADSGQFHGSVQNRLLRPRGAVGPTGPPGTLPPHAAPAGRRGRRAGQCAGVLSEANRALTHPGCVALTVLGTSKTTQKYPA